MTKRKIDEEEKELLTHFKEQFRPTGAVLLHKKKPVWVVKYGTWKVFYSIGEIPRGFMPWAAMNQSLSKDGFDNRKDALLAAILKAKE